MTRPLAAALLALVVAAGCGTQAGLSDAPRPSFTSGGSTPAAGSCHARGSGEMVLPDAACTPGATNPAVTPQTMGQTICARGWTKTVRPPTSVTDPLKRQQLAAYGYTGSPRGYEEDHLIPLELGGAPSDPKNLWPERGASPNPKDDVEDAANHEVCSGRMPLATAQQAIARDWISLGRELGVV